MALMNPTMGAMPPATDDDPEYTAAVQSGDLQKLFSLLEREQGLPAGYLRKTAQIESRMNPNAQNPKSSAGGLFQQTNGNARQYGIEDKFDPVQSALGAAMFAGDNANYLSSKLGRDPTAGELYLAHQQGPKGALALLSNPNAPAASVVGSAAAGLNGGGGLTAGQLASKWTSKLDNPADLPAEGAIPVSMDSGKPGFNVPPGGSPGLMNKPAYEPYKPADEGFGVGDTISAIGQALMSGTRQNPLGNFPAILAAQDAARAKREDRRYGMYKDNRNFDWQRSEADRAQGNTDRGFGLQSQQFDLSKANTEADNARADKQLGLQTQQAQQPKIMQDASGGVIAVKPDGSGVTTLSPGQKIQTEAGKVAERRQIASELGLQEGTPEHSAYLLNGKLPDTKDGKPFLRNVKQADGSEVVLQYDPATKEFLPIKAPQGGAAVGAGPANPYSNASGGKTTGEQDKSGGFTDRMLTNEQTIRGLESQGTSAVQRGMNFIPLAGSYLTSDDYKKYNAAKNNWIAAQLRKESGAAISKSEYDEADKQYFPQPNDPPQLVEQKRKLRETAIKGMARDAGPGYAPSHTFDENGQMQPYKRPGAPSAKPAAADRFQALVSGGASKADAYAKMKEEGY